MIPLSINPSSEQQTRSSSFQDDDPFLDNVYSQGRQILGEILGSIIGGIFGFILLIVAIIITLVLVIRICACNHRCPLYKWRHRQEHPPIGVIAADGNANIHNNGYNDLKEENCLLGTCMSISLILLPKSTFFCHT